MAMTHMTPLSIAPQGMFASSVCGIWGAAGVSRTSHTFLYQSTCDSGSKIYVSYNLHYKKNE